LTTPILSIHKEDVPPFKKGGSIVRNSFFLGIEVYFLLCT